MIIKTITCHDVYNYGASLQAFALQHYLENLGHNVEIIDYKPWYLRRKYRLLDIEFKTKNYRYFIYKYSFLFRPLVALFFHRNNIKYIFRRRAFDKFKRRYLVCTSKKYFSVDSLYGAFNDTNVFIAGSDQIWNPEFPTGKDKAFYLDFVPQKCKRISYAASFGGAKLPVDIKDSVKQYLQKFSWISTRETSGVNIVEDLKLKADQVMDPVFLLSSDEWTSFCHIEHKQKYLLLYYLGKRFSEIEEFVRTLAKQKGLLIYSINDMRKVPFADKNINNAGPVEFIEYIKSASYVVSNSFHATCFSIIFKKQFVTFGLKGFNNSSRMTDLLGLLDLSEHFVNHNESFHVYEIDYESIECKIKQHIKDSKSKLNKNLAS